MAASFSGTLRLLRYVAGVIPGVSPAGFSGKSAAFTAMGWLCRRAKRGLWRWIVALPPVWIFLCAVRLLPDDMFESKSLPRQPLILYWTKFYDNDFNRRQHLYQEAVRGLRNCPLNNCVITGNRSLLNQSSAVIFHARDMRWDILPAYRDPQQYYVFHLLESPPHTVTSLASLAPGFFNLTFTYRLDSDIVADSYFQHYKPPMWTDWSSFEETWRVKTKLAVAFVSNCITPSRRNLVLEELREYMAIDVYGKCGPLKCNPTSTKKNAACNGLVSTYKFFLAFENSICRDYVTEKIHRAYAQNTVPVVLGGANYTALFPPNSFINIRDFPSAKALAEHLLFLSTNSAAYQTYFEWKLNPVYATLPSALHERQISWCKLCQMINEPERKRMIKWNLEEWWHTMGQCIQPLVSVLPEGKLRWVWLPQTNPPAPQVLHL